MTGLILVTTCVTTCEVVALWLPSPLYAAARLCEPRARDDVVVEAVVPEIVALPNVVLPSLKVTVPVAPVDTVAVRVTVCP
jgi:hypothetical protein